MTATHRQSPTVKCADSPGWFRVLPKLGRQRWQQEPAIAERQSRSRPDA